eukprot:2269814-Pyramimonas_sp.AAC.1
MIGPHGVMQGDVGSEDEQQSEAESTSDTESRGGVRPNLDTWSLSSTRSSSPSQRGKQPQAGSRRDSTREGGCYPAQRPPRGANGAGRARVSPGTCSPSQ